jgi:cell division protein FtsN
VDLTPAEEVQSTPAQDRPEVQVESSLPADTPEARFSMDPYLQEVGSDGWALHLYSLPDRPAAEQQAAALERRGFRTEIRPFVLKDKGLWYRVYVGSFLTRREALEAKDPLLETLNIDWARVTEF